MEPLSPFKAPIDEEFSYIDGVASWRTPGESGSIMTDEPAFYLPNRLGFKLAGTFHEVGFKFGKYWNVSWYEKKLPGGHIV